MLQNKVSTLHWPNKVTEDYFMLARHNNLANYTQSLIRRNASINIEDEYELSINQLTPDQLTEFAAECITNNSYRDCGFDFVLNYKYIDELSASFARWLLSGKDDHRDVFLEGLTKCAVDYYRNTMEQFLDDNMADARYYAKEDAKLDE